MTPEIVDCSTNSPAEMFLIEALVAQEDWLVQIGGQEVLKDGLKVILTVNDVQVSFVATARGFMERASRHIEAEARDIAIEMVSAAGLDPLRRALEAAEHNIRTILEDTPIGEKA